MNIRTAESLALILMHQEGLVDKGWVFKFDKAKRRFGNCSYRKQIISLSTALTELNDETTVKNTILHEIAHALTGSGVGHGRQWKQVARSIGCDAQVLYDSRSVVTPEHKYIGICPDGHTHKAHRRRSYSACAKCCHRYNNGKFSEKYLIKWKEA